MENCVFCGIASGKIKADIVRETGNFIVIRDINPVSPVHLLIISRKHFKNILDARKDKDFDPCDFFDLVGSLARDYSLEDKGFRTVINTGYDGGQTVGHFHVHFMAGRGFGWPPG